MTYARTWLEGLMTEHRGSRQTWRRRWPLMGLMLVLLMLGHDALMASEAVAATQGPEAGVHHAPVSPGHEHVLPADHDAPSKPPHPEQCSVGFVALIRSANDKVEMADVSLPVALIAVEAAPASVLDRAAAWEEPHWPPGTLRALTQVYRI
jgi:hypothetical protein